MGGRIDVQLWQILKDLQLGWGVPISIQRPDSTTDAIPVRRVAKQQYLGFVTNARVSSFFSKHGNSCRTFMGWSMHLLTKPLINQLRPLNFAGYIYIDASKNVNKDREVNISNIGSTRTLFIMLGSKTSEVKMISNFITTY